MFLDNENNDETVVEDTAENVVEQATEELVEGGETTAEENEGKVYTEADIEKMVNEKVDELLPDKIRRAKTKLQRDNQKELEKYQRLENILGAALGTDDLEEMENKLTDFYSKQGVQIPTKPRYSENDLKVLAEAEANEIINSGYEEIVSEVDRLASKGVKNMTEREKITFQRLAEERKKQESMKDLAKIGVGEKEIQDKDYQEFAKNLNPNMSEKDKYQMYLKYRPKQKTEPIGSMKNNSNSNKKEVKDFYTREEALKFTQKEVNENPKLYEAIVNSARKW
jgi:hypothetical protein